MRWGYVKCNTWSLISLVDFSWDFCCKNKNASKTCSAAQNFSLSNRSDTKPPCKHTHILLNQIQPLLHTFTPTVLLHTIHIPPPLPPVFMPPKQPQPPRINLRKLSNSESRPNCTKPSPPAPKLLQSLPHPHLHLRQLFLFNSTPNTAMYPFHMLFFRVRETSDHGTC